MRKYTSLIIVFLLIFAVTGAGTLVHAQENSHFHGIMQRISELEGLTTEQKEEIIVRSIELHYADGLPVDPIYEVLDEYEDYDGIMVQYDELDNEDNDDIIDWFDDDNFDFGGTILEIFELDDLNSLEREEIMVRANELHYENGIEIDQISGVFDEYDDYDGIMAEFDELENNNNDEDDGLFGGDGLFDEDDDGLFD